MGEAGLAAQAAVDAGVAAAVLQRSGATEAVVAGLEHVHARALGGRIGGAGLQQAARAVGQADDDRAQALGRHLIQRGQRNIDAVIDAGVQQPALQLGHVLGIIAVAGVPGRQVGDPVGIGRTARADPQTVQPHQFARGDVEIGLHGEGRVVHDDAARFGLGVGVAFARQAGHDAAFGGQDVGGPARIARRQGDFLGHDLFGHGVGDGRDPVDLGLAQNKAAAGRDGDDGDGLVFALDVVLKRRLVVAFRAQQGLGRLHGAAGAAPGFEAVGRGGVALADGLFQLTTQLGVDLAANLGLGLSRQSGVAAHDRERHAGEKKIGPRRQTGALVQSTTAESKGSPGRNQ
ncbi:hypothetical protein D3C72_938780 [compost metagenome]